MQLNHTHSSNVILEGIKLLSTAGRLPPINDEDEIHSLLSELKDAEELDMATIILGNTLLHAFQPKEGVAVEFEDRMYLIASRTDEDGVFFDIQEDTDTIINNDLKHGDMVFLDDSGEVVQKNV